MRLLLISSSEQNDPLYTALLGAEYQIDQSPSLAESRYLLEEVSFDIILLDLSLGDSDALQLIRLWRRQHNHTPIICIAAALKATDHAALDAFTAGTDDFVSRETEPALILARMQSLLRRAQPHQCPRLQAGGIRLETSRQTAVVLHSGEEIPLSDLEFRLLQQFLRYPDRLFSRQQLLDGLYRFNKEPDSNVLESYIRKLRRKLGHHCFQNKRNQGYRFMGVQ
ncbi:response regulator transcription factor [Neptuniibacter halophilus]|uniref:response regulator transcription factor n=1 Tax=Neptuniibacter halophilus TaxID=651666 RepID=UPI00257354D6|nr:response regulator transcription factor [Neptuniibacter halophilus]